MFDIGTFDFLTFDAGPVTIAPSVVVFDGGGRKKKKRKRKLDFAEERQRRDRLRADIEQAIHPLEIKLVPEPEIPAPVAAVQDTAKIEEAKILAAQQAEEEELAIILMELV